MLTHILSKLGRRGSKSSPPSGRRFVERASAAQRPKETVAVGVRPGACLARAFPFVGSAVNARLFVRVHQHRVERFIRMTGTRGKLIQLPDGRRPDEADDGIGPDMTEIADAAWVEACLDARSYLGGKTTRFSLKNVKRDEMHPVYREYVKETHGCIPNEREAKIRVSVMDNRVERVFALKGDPDYVVELAPGRVPDVTPGFFDTEEDVRAERALFEALVDAHLCLSGNKMRYLADPATQPKPDPDPLYHQHVGDLRKQPRRRTRQAPPEPSRQAPPADDPPMPEPPDEAAQAPAPEPAQTARAKPERPKNGTPRPTPRQAEPEKRERQQPKPNPVPPIETNPEWVLKGTLVRAGLQERTLGQGKKIQQYGITLALFKKKGIRPLWGTDLERAINEAGARKGDWVEVQYLGRQDLPGKKGGYKHLFFAKVLPKPENGEREGERQSGGRKGTGKPGRTGWLGRIVGR